MGLAADIRLGLVSIVRPINVGLQWISRPFTFCHCYAFKGTLRNYSVCPPRTPSYPRPRAVEQQGGQPKPKAPPPLLVAVQLRDVGAGDKPGWVRRRLRRGQAGRASCPHTSASAPHPFPRPRPLRRHPPRRHHRLPLPRVGPLPLHRRARRPRKLSSSSSSCAASDWWLAPMVTCSSYLFLCLVLPCKIKERRCWNRRLLA